MRVTWVMASLVLAAGAGNAAPGLLPDLRAALEGAIERQDARAVVVGLYDEGGTGVFGFGRVAHADERAPTGDTAFEIGSVTKVFTALLAQAQVDANRLSWDASLADCLPDTDFQSRAVADITLRELASHTSGLPRIPENLLPTDSFDFYAGYARSDLLNYLGRLEPEERAREYAYSNLGVGLLGLIAADAAGTDFASAMARDVLHPLGMSSSTVGPAGIREGQLAAGFSDGADIPNWTFDALAGAGAIVSTADDLLRFIRSNLEAGEMSATLAAIREPQANGETALGWHLKQLEAGDRIYWHNGGTGGYASFLAIRPATATGVAILASSTHYQRFTELGLAQIEGVTLSAGEVDLTPYPGAYRLGEGFHLTIFIEDGRLFGQATGQGPFPLTPSGEDEFEFPAADIRVTFERSANEPAHELTLVQGGRATPAPRVDEEQGVRAYEAIDLEPAKLEEYVGRYRLAPEVIVTIEVRDAQLYAQLTGQPAFPVFAYDTDRFFFKVVDAQLEFERDDDGAVAAVVLHQMGVQRAPRID